LIKLGSALGSDEKRGAYFSTLKFSGLFTNLAATGPVYFLKVESMTSCYSLVKSAPYTISGADMQGIEQIKKTVNTEKTVEIPTTTPINN
jgi:hypothetical protein